MRILISSPGEKAINILFPTRMLCNCLTATIAGKALSKHVPQLSKAKIGTSELRRLAKEINRIKRKHPRLCLVDVQSADGNIVQIML